MRVILIDNYDSFTHLLLRLIESSCGFLPKMMKNDHINYHELDQCDFIVLSPGPGLPEEAGDLMKVIGKYHQIKPILGVCLGHQAIAKYFGCGLINPDQIAHGMQARLKITERNSLFGNLPSGFEVGRYHSWIVDELPENSELQVTSVDLNGFIMGIKHRFLPIEGVQFHPESYMSQYGGQLIDNFAQRHLPALINSPQ